VDEAVAVLKLPPAPKLRERAPNGVRG